MENITSYIGYNKNIIKIVETENGFIVIKESHPRRVRLAATSDEAGKITQAFLDEKHDEGNSAKNTVGAALSRA